MRTIIAGSRTFSNYDVVKQAIKESRFIVTSVVSGKCAGVDALGERWAKENNIYIDPNPADWSKYGNPAGPIRNRVMASKADALIAIWDGKSPGTKNMIGEAKKKNIAIYIHRI